MRLIDKTAAYNALKHEAESHELSFSVEAYDRAARIIDQMPTVEVNIDRAAILRLCNEIEDVFGELCGKCIYEAPKVEAEPVRRGRWLSLEGWFNKSIVKCSVCGNTLDMDGVNAGRGDANFCPNCGADMREEGADNG